MSAVHTERLRGYTIEICDDPVAEYANPRQDDNLGVDNLGVMICQHSRYTLGDRADDDVVDFERALNRFRDNLGGRRGVQAFARWLRIFHGTTVILPLYLCDSGITMSAGANLYAGTDHDPTSRSGRFTGDAAGWDTSTVGFIFDTAATRELIGTPDELVAEALKEEVGAYALWLEGHVYGYRVLDGDDDEIESCWGFLGDYEEGALVEARSVVPEEQAPAVFRLTVKVPAGGHDQLAAILSDLGGQLLHGPLEDDGPTNVRDVNGNTIGHWTYATGTEETR